MAQGMKNLKSLAIAAALVLAVGAGNAQANTIQVDDGNGGPIHDVVGTEIGNLYLNGSAAFEYDIVYELIGGVSGYENTLTETIGGGILTEGSHDGLSRVQVGVTSVGPTLLQFKFTQLNPAWEFANGGNNSANPASFRVTFAGANAVLIGLDDTGAGPDKDFNDWFGRIAITQRRRSVNNVPDGGSALALLGIALTGLGVVRRRLS